MTATSIPNRPRAESTDEPAARSAADPVAEKRRRLLEKLRGDVSSQTRSSIPRRENRERARLSFTQRRLWFLERMVPGSAAYNVAIALTVSGRLDLHVLQSAVDAMVARHETMRTTIRETDGEPWQAIAETGSVPVVARDLAEAPETVGSHVAEAARVPFDLATGPLFRVLVHHLGGDRHVLLLVAHHIVIDGWSLGLFWQELLALYDAFARGRPSPLAPLAVQYGDFAEWQHADLERERQKAALGYWRAQLADVEPSDLPLDRPRPPVQTFVGGDFTFPMSAPLRARLDALCREARVSLFTVLLAALQVMLHRYTGQRGIAVGSPVSNRVRVEIEPLIGLFVNTLVYKADVDREESFLGFLAKVQKAVAEAQANQEVPFEAIVEAIAPERYLSMNPLFQVCFNLLPQRGMPTSGSLRIEESAGVRNGWSKFDLWIGAIDRGDDLLVEVEFNSVVFEEETARRMLRGWQTVLEQVTADPQRPIGEIAILDAETRRMLVETWNDTDVAYPGADRPLHAHVLDQCARTPDATSLVFGEERASYASLARRSGRLATRLLAAGVGPDRFVGLHLHRSIDLVVAIQGVLRAGGAYLPLEPSHPAARLGSMIEDAAPVAILTTSDLVGGLPATDAEVIVLDRDWPRIEALPEPDVPPPCGEIAYLLYTSGSTGRPKGVPNTHAGIVNRLLWMQDRYRLRPEDRVLHKTPFGFDVSVWELCWPLMVGATMVIAAPDRHADPDYLAQVIGAERITTLHFVPSILEAALAAPGFAESCGSLVRVICSGEALPIALQRRFFERLPHAELHNLYGPTEAAIDVTSWQCRREDEHTVPIGRPVANTQIYILDEAMEPVPVGVNGELYIGGVQVALGYLGRPELTRERFVPDPFRSGGRGVLYRTGDLARLRADGVIEYRGRADSQIKLRGVRIELEEIEAALESHDAVRHAAVVVQKDETGAAERLVAFVVPDEARSGAADEVEDWRSTFDVAYADADEQTAADLHLGGWKSSFGGGAFGPDVMRDYVEGTVRRILDLAPRRVLEIGVGTGLIMARVAPRCEAYVGTDISRTGLDFVRERLVAARDDLRHVVLREAAADAVSAIAEGPFDVVVLNSVVQYFPDAAYLGAVLRQALDALAPGGAIFLGDVRDLGALPLFHAELEMARSGPADDVASLRRRIARHVESELVVDPAFFSVLKREDPRIGDIEIQLRGGRRSDEMTRYRYDAILRLGVREGRLPDPILRWGRDVTSVDEVGERARAEPDRTLAVLGVPNGRLAQANALARALAAAAPDESLAVLGHRVWSGRPLDGELCDAIDPQEWWALAERLGRRAVVSFMPGSAAGALAVTLLAPGARAPAPAEWPEHARALERPASAFTTDPARRRAASASLGGLRNHLADRLPSHMVPAAFVPLDALPVTGNGKLDRGALARLAPPVEAQAPIERAPRTPTERLIGEVWGEVLGMEVADANANFFALGGDSIRSMQVVGRARGRGVEMTPQMIFRYDSLAALAEAVDRASAAGEPGAASAPSAAEPRAADAAAAIAAPARTGARVESYPLAPFQSWALSCLRARGTPGLYQVHRCTTAPRSAASPEDFRRAFAEQTRAHPILRTSFETVGGETRQVVHDAAPAEVVHESWRGHTPERQDAALEAYLAADRGRGIEPESPGAMRYLLADLDDEACLIVMSFSFLCLDGWSYNLLTDELLARLDALKAGRAFEERRGPPFRDFVEHAAAWDRAPSRDYWTRALAGLGDGGLLPRRAPGPASGTKSGYGRQFVSLDASVSAALRAAARSAHVPLNILFQAAWSIVLAARTGRDDVAHGVLLAGRSSGPPGIDAMVGPTLNILPVRTRVVPEEPVARFLPGVMERLVELSRHELIGLDEVLAWAGRPALTPQNDSYLVFQNVGTHNSERFGAGYFFSKLGYPIRVDVFPTEIVSLHVSYDQALFDDLEAAGLLAAFRAVLDRLAADAGGTVAGLVEAAGRAASGAAPGYVVREGAARIADVRAGSAP